jgi:hypothetical protein
MSLNIAKIQEHEMTIERIDEAIRKAENFGDRKAWLTVEGKETLLNVTELNAMRDKETKTIKEIVAGRNA